MSESGDPQRRYPSGVRSPFAWVSTTYFAEGFPFSIAHKVVEAMFVELGASLQMVGLTGLFHLPWNLKFLWAPLLDRYQTKRWFLIAAEVVLCVLLFGLSQTMALSNVFAVASVAFVVFAFFAATHDVAIDGYYLEALDEKGQSEFVGYRAAAYRVTIPLGGGIISIAGLAGWGTAWLVSGLIMLALTIFHWRFLPRVEAPGQPIAGLFAGLRRPRAIVVLICIGLVLIAEWLHPVLRPFASRVGEVVERIPFFGGLRASGWIGLILLLLLMAALSVLPWLRRILQRRDSPGARAFLDFLDQPKAGRILAFVALFRVGESLLSKMSYKFLSDEVALSATFLGATKAGAGGVASIVGTLLGGHLIARDGLRKWIWPFVLAQNVLNLLYMTMALAEDPTSLGGTTVTAVIIAENFGEGLGTAVFMVYLLRCVDPRHKATHMAILTALMSVGVALAGVASGFLTAAMGYELYFGFTFVATFPAMALLLFVPHLDGREDGKSAKGAVPEGDPAHAEEEDAGA